MDFEAAARRGVQRLKKGPVAVAGRYDQQAGRVVIELDSGLEIAFRPQHAQGLYFPAIDADLYLPALLEGFLGSNAWMAVRMGQVGGRATTQAKHAVARANGRLGGRQRKKVTS